MARMLASSDAPAVVMGMMWGLWLLMVMGGAHTVVVVVVVESLVCQVHGRSGRHRELVVPMVLLLVDGPHELPE
jgi:uncharacterized membrane protein